MMRPLTGYVLRSRAAPVQGMARAGLELDMSVNLAVPNLVDPELPDLVEAMLRRGAVEPAWLCLELTESSVMADPDRALETSAGSRSSGSGCPWTISVPAIRRWPTSSACRSTR